MRASLLHTLGESRTSRRRRQRRSHAGPEQQSAPQAPAAEKGPVLEPCSSAVDPAVARVREAGGPIDLACYTCTCGYTFSAPVSTTVSCPHCGVGQAW